MTTEPQSIATPAAGALVPVAAIGTLSLALVAGLTALGMTDQTDARIAAWLTLRPAETFPLQLPDWALWLATAVFAFGTAWAILGTHGTWRRTALWITTLFIVAAWAPVLVLAAHVPAISGPLIATFWSGLCAMIHASHHPVPGAATPRPIP